MLKVLSFVIVLLTFINIVKCAEILVVFHYPLKSLHLGGVALAEILADNDHNVTFVSSVEISPPPKAFTHVFLEDVADATNAHHSNYFAMNTNPYYQAYNFEHLGIETANATMRSPQFKQLLASKKFDLIIVEVIFSDSLMFIGEHFKAPLLLYSSVDANYFSNLLIGNYVPASYMPNFLTGYTSDMTFFQRFDNFFVSLASYIIRYAIGIPGHEGIIKENFGAAHNIQEIHEKASVMLMNSDTSLSEVLPQVPGMIDIGGFHIKKPKRLPRDLENLLNNSKHGVIYFSLGSILKSSNMPNQTIKTILAVFSKLKQTVLWKWEADELPGKPSNVIVRKWLPQNDILAHKNVKLFITHGGMHSLLETVYHGVPCVIIPVFFDQIRNAKKAHSFGFAEYINFEEITSDGLEQTVGRVLNNISYMEAAKKRSHILHDKPLSPAETLVFWANYVIRHKGAPHLKVSSLKLNWYQFFLFDVVIFIIACLISFTIILRYLCKSILPKGANKKLKSK